MFGESRSVVSRTFGTMLAALGACSVMALLLVLFPLLAVAADTMVPGNPVPKSASVPASSPSARPESRASSLTGDDLRVLRGDGAYADLHVFRPASDCSGVAILSPGAGDDRDALAWLGRALSGYGWLAVTMAHKESGHDSLRDRVRSGGLRDGLLVLTTDPEAYVDRLEDTGAALRWARAQCRTGPAVFGGHSMGAAVVMIEAGAKNRLGVASGDRFDGYIAFSPQGSGRIFPAGAWREIRKPVLLVTGTRDEPLDGRWQARTEPYADMPAGCHWLAVVDGATHFNFAGFGYGHGDIEARVLPVVRRFLDNLRAHRCVAPAPEVGVKFDAK